jgi:hypothetical protein
VVRDRRFRLEMLATASTKSGFLQAPTTSGMNRKISETLNAAIDIQLSVFEGSRARQIYSGSGRHAGLEIVGDLAKLLAMLKLQTTAHTKSS